MEGEGERGSHADKEGGGDGEEKGGRAEPKIIV